MDINEQYEYMAALFYKETRFMAPGKDDPLCMDREGREKAWAEWKPEFYSDALKAHKAAHKPLTYNQSKQNLLDALSEMTYADSGDSDLNWQMIDEIQSMQSTVEGWQTKSELEDEQYTKRQRS